MDLTRLLRLVQRTTRLFGARGSSQNTRTQISLRANRSAFAANAPQLWSELAPILSFLWPVLAPSLARVSDVFAPGSPRAFGEFGFNCPARDNASFKGARADLPPSATKGVAHDQVVGHFRVRGSCLSVRYHLRGQFRFADARARVQDQFGARRAPVSRRPLSPADAYRRLVRQRRVPGEMDPRVLRHLGDEGVDQGPPQGLGVDV